MAAPTFVSSSVLAGGSSNSPTVVAPASILDNDILIYDLYREINTDEAVTWPAGFTQLASGTQTGSGPDVQHDRAWKRAASESGNYQASWATSCYREASITVWRGCETSGNPYDADGTPANNGSAGVTIDMTAITTLGADRTIVATYVTFSGGAWTHPTGYTERLDAGVMGVASKEQAAEGSTGTVTAERTGGGSSWHNGVLLALKAPAVAAPFVPYNPAPVWHPILAR